MSKLGWLTARPIAHRGYHDRTAGRIENTLPAAEAAIAHDFAIECDLQLTADGRVVVFHDDTLDRLSEAEGPVGTRTLADLRAVRLTDSDAGIPTLEELLDLVDGRVPLVIELKSRFDGDRRLEQAVAPILADYTGPAAVMSFDPQSMRAIRRLAPKPAARHDRRQFRRRLAVAGADALRAPPPARRGDRVAAFRLFRHPCAAGQRAADAAPDGHPVDLLDRAHAGRPGQCQGLDRPDHLRGLRPGRGNARHGLNLPALRGGLAPAPACVLHRFEAPLDWLIASTRNQSMRP